MKELSKEQRRLSQQIDALTKKLREDVVAYQTASKARDKAAEASDLAHQRVLLNRDAASIAYARGCYRYSRELSEKAHKIGSKLLLIHRKLDKIEHAFFMSFLDDDAEAERRGVL